MTPGKKIKEIREKIKHLTQAEFAREYGLKLNTVRFIEQDKQDVPDDLALALEEEYRIPFKWWKTGEGPICIEQQEYWAATGTHGRPHLRVVRSDQVSRAEVIRNIGIAEKEIETIDDEKLKEIAKKLGKPITVEYIEDDKKDKTCKIYPDGQIIDCSSQEEISRTDMNLNKLIGQYMTEFEAKQLLESLKNNKTFLFIFIEKLNTDPKAAKQLLLKLEN
ncbi:MAG: hypothetical protein A2Y25_09095 [Candidatus Melainabacteria bacterium GWF2_37_15]|nr:MAG: hypothetical protein A2Y25_09095 [Candidatus Melainabacteria bacterium GWF2_37_15]